MQNSANTGPVRGILKNSEPNLLLTADPTEGNVRAQFVVSKDFFSLPRDIGRDVKCSCDASDINFEAGRNNGSVPRSPHDL